MGPHARGAAILTAPPPDRVPAMRTITNLELRESNPDGTEGAGLSHTAGGMFLLRVVEIAEEGEPRGGVTVVHDAGDHGGRYERFAQFLAQDGWAVSLPDLRGHGSSEGERGHSAGLPEVARDLDSAQDHLTIFAPSIPLALVGQGLGGLYALHYLLDRPGRARAAVVLSPLLRPRFELPAKKKGLGGLFKKVGPKTPGRIGHAASKMTGIAEEQRALASDALVHDVVTLRAAECAAVAAELVRARVREIAVPVLVLHGADDELADPADSLALAGGDVEVQIVPGAKHDLLHDAPAGEVMQIVRDWLDRRVER